MYLFQSSPGHTTGPLGKNQTHPLSGEIGTSSGVKRGQPIEDILPNLSVIGNVVISVNPELKSRITEPHSGGVIIAIKPRGQTGKWF
jgi:hypothetical protein